MSHASLGPQPPSPRPRLSLAEYFGCAMRQGDAFTQAFGLFDDLADSPHVRLFAHRPNLGGLRCVVFGRQGPNIAGVARAGTDRAVFADVGDVAADASSALFSAMRRKSGESLGVRAWPL